MWVVRPVRTNDTDAVLSLAAALGPGMTTFPSDKDTIAAKIEASVASFAGHNTDASAQYFMVLEDDEDQSLLGVSAVYPKIGHPYGFFSYHIDRLVAHSDSIEMFMDCKVLNLSNAYTGLTEIGTLAVNPNLRKGGAGKLLARARYMLMASFPDLFAEHVIAEMRGWQNEQGDSPVWSAIGEKFFKIDFSSADRLSAVRGAEFIANLMPKFPIYLDLLPKDAQAAMGKAHDTSAIAMRMLLQEGFRFENYIDVFDGGPQVIAPLKDIMTIKNSVSTTVSSASSGRQGENYLVCNSDLKNFRLIQTNGTIEREGLNITVAAQQALGVKIGDNVRYSLSKAHPA